MVLAFIGFRRFSVVLLRGLSVVLNGPHAAVHGSQWFSQVLIGFHRFSVVQFSKNVVLSLSGSHIAWFSVVSTEWFSSGSVSMVMVLIAGSQWFSPGWLPVGWHIHMQWFILNAGNAWLL